MHAKPASTTKARAPKQVTLPSVEITLLHGIVCDICYGRGQSVQRHTGREILSPCEVCNGAAMLPPGATILADVVGEVNTACISHKGKPVPYMTVTAKLRHPWSSGPFHTFHGGCVSLPAWGPKALAAAICEAAVYALNGTVHRSLRLLSEPAWPKGWPRTKQVPEYLNRLTTTLAQLDNPKTPAP